MAINGTPTVGEGSIDLPWLDWQTGLGRTCEELAAQSLRRVGLQLPEGLRGQTAAIMEFMMDRLGPRAEVLLWAEPTYGACDLADRPLRELGARALVHLGHTPMPCHAGQYALPVHFVPVTHTGRLVLKEASLTKLEAIFDEVGTRGERADGKRRVGLVTTAQHLHLLDELTTWLEASGWQVLVGTGDQRLAYPGQLLGCNSTAAWAVEDNRLRGFLYLGTGQFHPLAVALGSRLPVATLNPHSGAIERVDPERFLRQRFGSIAKAKEAIRWAVLESPQVGQCRTDVADKVTRQLIKADRLAYRVAATHQSPEQLAGLKVEAAVVSCCPRLAIEEGPTWPVPLLTPPELELALGLREWDPDGEGYPFDEIL